MLAQWSVCSCRVELFPSCTSVSMEVFFIPLFSILHSFPCSAIPHSLGFSCQIQKANKIETPSPYMMWSPSFFFFHFHVMDKRIYVHTAHTVCLKGRLSWRNPAEKKSTHIQWQLSYKKHILSHPTTRIRSFPSSLSTCHPPGGEVRLGWLFCLQYDVVFPHFESMPE